jgi:hypothetical protein
MVDAGCKHACDKYEIRTVLEELLFPVEPKRRQNLRR